MLSTMMHSASLCSSATAVLLLDSQDWLTARQLTKGSLALSIVWQGVAAAVATYIMVLMPWRSWQPNLLALVLARICW